MQIDKTEQMQGENLEVRYRDYFKKTYKATFSVSDTLKQKKFLWKQLELVSGIVHLDRFKNDRILEIGSGLGSWAGLIHDKGFTNYMGIDLDPDVVNFCNQTLGNFFFKQSLEKIDLEKDGYKIITALEVLEHLDSPQAGIKKIFDLLDKDGIFIGTTPFPFRKNVLADKTHRYCLHPENWKKFFLESGFKKVDTYPMSFFPSIWRINKHLNFRLPFYVPFKYFISTTLVIAYK